jgi:hypothetical protein
MIRRMFVFAEREGSIMEVWFDPEGKFYRQARETGKIEGRDPRYDRPRFSRSVNWIASVTIDEDYDFTLQAPRETA